MKDEVRRGIGSNLIFPHHGNRNPFYMLISLLARIACALVLLVGASPALTAKAIDHLGASTFSVPAGITVLVLHAPATITLTATASDPDGTINRVEFYAGSTLIGASTTPPYSVTWTPLASGPFVLTARAFDNLNASGDSAPVNVTVTGAITYLHNDFAGNPIAATDASGAILWKENFRPYGDRLNNQSAAATNRQWFHGKAVDADTGLSYFGARYYDPVPKQKVANWLMQRDEILAFCQARRTEGGSGAVVVLLKGQRGTRNAE
jgi:hypothetical protein